MGLVLSLSIAYTLISSLVLWLLETGRGPVLRRFLLLR
jgi:hypothetical protein